MNFTVYTMAMLGMIFFAVFVYKKVMNGSIYKNGSKNLSIEERMSINPRKSLLIVKAGDERFLVASDMERTSLISKLQNPEMIRMFKRLKIFKRCKIRNIRRKVKKKILSHLKKWKYRYLCPKMRAKFRKMNSRYILSR